MKKIPTLLILAMLSVATVHGQEIILTEESFLSGEKESARSVAQIDGDEIADSLYYDFQTQSLVILLSDRDFEPMVFPWLEGLGGTDFHYYTAGDGGFSSSYSTMRTEGGSIYDYDREVGKFRFTSVWESYHGPDGYFDERLDLLTGELECHQSYVDSGDLIYLPTLKKTVELPAYYLEDDEEYFDFEAFCNELFEAHKAQAEQDGMVFRVMDINDSLRVCTRRITRAEYDTRREQSGRLRPKPYRVVTDSVKTRRMLRRRGGGFIAPESSVKAYYPKLGVAVLWGEDGSDHPVDLTDRQRDSLYLGNPAYHAVSPDGRWRINGWYNNAAGWVQYFIERRDGSSFRLEGDLIGHEWRSYSTSGWVWTDNDTVLFINDDSNECYEMKVDNFPLFEDDGVLGYSTVR